MNKTKKPKHKIDENSNSTIERKEKKCTIPYSDTEQNEFNSRELIDVMFFAPIEIGELKLINDISEVLFHKIKN